MRRPRASGRTAILRTYSAPAFGAAATVPTMLPFRSATQIGPSANRSSIRSLPGVVTASPPGVYKASNSTKASHKTLEIAPASAGAASRICMPISRLCISLFQSPGQWFKHCQHYLLAQAVLAPAVQVEQVAPPGCQSHRGSLVRRVPHGCQPGRYARRPLLHT